MPFWKCFPCMRFQNDEVVTKLDYSNCALTDVPPDVSQHERTLEELYLSSNRIRALSPQLFYCQGIRVLFVNDNELESLPNAIGSLRQLQHLNLARNGLSGAPDNIKSCKNLTRLDLSLNNLQRLPDAITSLISLQELLLNETNLEFLPANFGRLVNLRILELRSNNLITLPKSMSRLSNLNRIDIGANEFTELPEVICQLSQLRELWIDVNRIRRISPNVSNLRELKHFEANNNLLLTLPNEISNWRNLEVLSVSTNDMETLPFSIGMLKSLVTLQCEANQLRELPDSICHLENLEEMVISHNFILRLPSTIGMLSRLRFFCADENILRSLPAEMCSCTNLAVLSVRSNKIVELPQNIGQLVNLHVLNLVDNYITHLPLSVLSLTKLTALWISDNQSQPLVPLQYLNASNLTCFMLPQQAVLQQNGTQPNEYSDNGSTNSLLQQRDQDKTAESFGFSGRAVPNTSQRIFFADQKADATLIPIEGAVTPQTQRIAFENEEKPGNTAFVAQNDSVTSPSRRICFADEVKGAEALATRLMRSPTPYPKELRLMAKYVRNNHHEQIQQQNAAYVKPMIAAQAVRPAATSTSPDQIDGKKYVSTAAAAHAVDGVKEARVLLNPGGNSVLLQQMHNSMGYHLIDHIRSADADVGESAHNSNNIAGHQNAQYLKQPSQMYSASTNGLNGPTNNIYSGQMQMPQQSPSIDIGGERLTPTAYVSQAAFSSQQQQYYQHYRNSMHQSTSSVQQNYPDQGYPPSPSLYDQQLRDTLYESSGSAHQVSASPSIISSYSQQGSQQQQQAQSMHSMQISKPPPYHIARAFTKKSREDLLSYDSIRNQINHCNGTDDGEEFSAIICDQDNIEIDQDDAKSEDMNRRGYCTLNGHDIQKSLSPYMDNSKRRCGPNDNDYDSIDHQNNNDSSLNRTYSFHCDDALINRHSLLSLQAVENGSLDGSESNSRRPHSRLSQCQEWNGTVNSDHTIDGITDGVHDMQLNSNSKFRAPPRSSSTTTWLFGLHKNPTVKQVAIKRDHEIGFEIQERPNQGIFVRGTHPNTSAATLLHANDKLLEVDGYDFTKICLVDAQQILDNSGPVINVMISRT